MTAYERSKRWVKANPERAKEHKRKWRARQRANNPCKACGRPIPFPSPGRKHCTACQPEAKKRQSQKHSQRRLAERAAYKLQRGCDRCGYRKCAAALDFHHRDPANKKHRVWIPHGDEYEKCDLLCSNCHHEAHEKDKKREDNGDVY